MCDSSYSPSGKEVSREFEMKALQIASFLVSITYQKEQDGYFVK